MLGYGPSALTQPTMSANSAFVPPAIMLCMPTEDNAMHNALSTRPRPMTVAEFLEWPGDGTGRRFELVDGELRPMSPGSQTHGRI
jgi:Uma2 family endonuclease